MFETMASHLDVLWQLLVVLFIGSVAVYLALRAGSAHIVHFMLWRILFGRGQPRDPDVARWVEGRRAWMQFRILSGARARSLASSKRVIRWAEQHGEEAVDVARCGGHFDLEQLRLTVPPRWEEVFFAVLSSAFLTGAAFAVAASFSSAAWVTVAVPDAHGLRLSPAGVYISDTRAAIDLSLCRSMSTAALASHSGLRLEEATAVCGWLADPAFVQKAAREVDAQRRALLIVSLLGLGYGWSTVRGFLASRAARAMGRRLESNKGARAKARRARHRRVRTHPSSDAGSAGGST